MDPMSSSYCIVNDSVEHEQKEAETVSKVEDQPGQGLPHQADVNMSVENGCWRKR